MIRYRLALFENAKATARSVCPERRRLAFQAQGSHELVRSGMQTSDKATLAHFVK